MKKVLFIAVLVILASCSNETSTSSKDSVCTDSINVDSLIKTSEARIDTMSVLLEEIKH
jgi:PBP1b-binding outer membrane lipoprotein LpoB